MNYENFTHYVDLYNEKTRGEHQRALITGLGEKEVYDAVSLCNRCGFCATACPTFLAEERENFSARGRNQIIRMVMEGRLRMDRDSAEIDAAVSSCLLCGACISKCYSRAPTPDIVLEAARALPDTPSRKTLSAAAGLLSSPRKRISIWIKLLSAARATGLVALAEKMKLLDAAGLAWAGRLHREAPKARFSFLPELLPSSRKAEISSKTACLYFASCGTYFLYPETGLAAMNILENFIGPVRMINNSCCGLASHNYGSLSKTREAAKNVIRAYEEAVGQNPDLPLVTDCSYCADFIRHYEQLFTDEPEWKEKARRLADNTKTIFSMIPEDRFAQKLSLIRKSGYAVLPDNADRKMPPIDWKTARVTFLREYSQSDGTLSDFEPILRQAFGKNFIPLPPGAAACTGTGNSIARGGVMSDKILRRTILELAAVQPDVVLTESSAAKMRLSKGLARYYPAAQAAHYCSAINDILKSDQSV